MSPQRFDSSGYVNEWYSRSFGAGDVFCGDVWSLGLTIMEMYIGYQPYCPPRRQFTTEFDLIADICMFPRPTQIMRLIFSTMCLSILKILDVTIAFICSTSYCIMCFLVNLLNSKIKVIYLIEIYEIVNIIINENY